MPSHLKRTVAVPIALISLGLLCASCAFHKTALITSSPPDAEVYIDGNYAGKTPYSVTFLLNNEPFTANEPVESPRQIKVVAQGFEPEVKVYNRIDRLAELPRHLTHFELKRSEDARAEKRPAVAKTDAAVPPPETSVKRVRWRNAARMRALIVGISDYQDPGLPRVKNGAADAVAMASFLRNAGVPTGQITTLTDRAATRNDIAAALRKLQTATLDLEDISMFFFSGHGAPIIEGGLAVESVLVPYDARESNLEDTGINLKTIWDRLKGARGTWIVILDSCFSGKPGRSILAQNLKGMAIIPKEGKGVQLPGNVSWLTATSGDNYANDLPEGNNGIFTHYLLRAFQGEDQTVDGDRNGLISLREAFLWSKSQVEEVSAKSLGLTQIPELIGTGEIVVTMPP